MDDFKKYLTDLKAMSEQDRSRTEAIGKTNCICGKCPTYGSCSANTSEAFYCILSKSSNCRISENGCDCRQCPVFKGLGLSNIYYCTAGSEEVQRGYVPRG